MFEFESTNKAIKEAASWLRENPGFDPRFTRIANVVLNSDEGTRDMTAEVLERSGVEVGSLDFSMAQYAAGVLKEKALMQGA